MFEEFIATFLVIPNVLLQAGGFPPSSDQTAESLQWRHSLRASEKKVVESDDEEDEALDTTLEGQQGA